MACILRPLRNTYAGSYRYDAMCFSKPRTCVHTLSHVDDLGGGGGGGIHMTVAQQSYGQRAIRGKMRQDELFSAPLTDVLQDRGHFDNTVPPLS